MRRSQRVLAVELDLSLLLAPVKRGGRVPANIMVPATAASGAVVPYSATARGHMDGGLNNIAPSCSPASGSTFPIENTTVQCTAVDSVGQTAAGTFTVTVDCCNLAISVSPTVVRRGQTVVGSVTLTNFSALAKATTLTFRLSATCSSNPTQIGPFTFMVQPGKLGTFRIPLTIPRSACLGTYTLTATGAFQNGGQLQSSATLTVVQ